MKFYTGKAAGVKVELTQDESEVDLRINGILVGTFGNGTLRLYECDEDERDAMPDVNFENAYLAVEHC